MKCSCCGEEMVQGSSKGPFPDLAAWRGTTTQEEVESNWLDVLRKKALLEEALKNDDPSKLENTCSDWEWQYCENIGLCPNSECNKKMQLKLMKGNGKK